MIPRTTSTVTDRGQVTIPKRLRERLGIRPGQRLVFEEAPGGRLVATKARESDPVDRVYGILPSKGQTDELIERIRGEPDPR